MQYAVLSISNHTVGHKFKQTLNSLPGHTHLTYSGIVMCRRAYKSSGKRQSCIMSTTLRRSLKKQNVGTWDYAHGLIHIHTSAPTTETHNHAKQSSLEKDCVSRVLNFLFPPGDDTTTLETTGLVVLAYIFSLEPSLPSTDRKCGGNDVTKWSFLCATRHHRTGKAGLTFSENSSCALGTKNLHHQHNSFTMHI